MQILGAYMNVETKSPRLMRGADGFLYLIDDEGCHAVQETDTSSTKTSAGLQTSAPIDHGASRAFIEASDHDAGRAFIEASDHGASRAFLEASDHAAGRAFIEASDHGASRAFIEASDHDAGRAFIEAQPLEHRLNS